MKLKALVTGGSRGIGKAICEELEKNGVDVYDPDRTHLNLSDRDDIQLYLNKYERTDILINCAAINLKSQVDFIRSEPLDHQFQINFHAPLRLIQAFSNHRKKNQPGWILNLSSIFSHATKPGRVAYSASKAALESLTRSAALELAPCGVMVNSLCPGYVDTEMTLRNNTHDQIHAIERAIPIGRLARPEEIAKVAAFLCSEKNTYLTGQTIIVDGGLSAKAPG